MNKRHIGSDFDEFLRQERLLADVEAAAIKKVIARLVERAMAETRITKTEMARRMQTSRAQLDRLLDPGNPSVTLATITKAARVLGKKLTVSFRDSRPYRQKTA